MPVTTLNNYLAGRAFPIEFAARVAEACEVSLEWLAVGKKETATEGDAALQIRLSVLNAISAAYAQINEKFNFSLGIDWFQETAIRTEKYLRAQELSAAEAKVQP